MPNPKIFLVASEAKDTACLEPLASALSEQGEKVQLVEFFRDLSENGGSAVRAFVDAPYPVAVVSSVGTMDLLTLLRPINSFLCVCVEHGIAPFKSYTYGRHLLSAHYYLAPTLGWARRLVSLYPEHRSKVRLGGYPKIDAIGDAVSHPWTPGERSDRMLVILSWGVNEESLRRLPDVSFIDYLLHPADRRHVSSTCLKQARVIVSDPEITYGLVASASVVVGDFSSLTLECLHLGRNVVFMIDPDLYKGSCDIDAGFFDRGSASFGLVPGTSLRVSPDDTITTSRFRELIERYGSDLAAFKAISPRASFPEEFLPPAGSNRDRCAAELLSIIEQESQISTLNAPSNRQGLLTANHMRLIARTYEALLGRSPDLEGLRTYLGILGDPGNGTIEATAVMGKAINHSAEAARRNGNACRSVVDAMVAILAREARLGMDRAAMLLDALSDQILPDLYRQQRDEATDNPGKIRWGTKLACTSDAIADDFILLAHAYAGEDRLGDAHHWLAKALEMHPEAGELHRFRASLFERMGRFEDALKAAKVAQAKGADEDAIASDIARISGLLTSDDADAEDGSPGHGEKTGRLDLRQFIAQTYLRLTSARQKTSRSEPTER